MLQVQVSIPSVVVQTSAIQSAAGYLDATLENRNLTLSATRASGPPSPDPKAPTSQHPLADSREEQVYVVSVSSGGAHAGLGFVNQPPASTLSINSASVEVRLNRVVPVASASTNVKTAAAAVVHAHADFVGVASQCCPSMLWPVVATMQQLQEQQQLLQQGTHKASPMPAATDHESSRGDMLPISSSTLPADDSGSLPGADTTQAATQASVPAAAPAPAPTAEDAVNVQWELCLQTSSSSQLEVMAQSGQWLMRIPAHSGPFAVCLGLPAYSSRHELKTVSFSIDECFRSGPRGTMITSVSVIVSAGKAASTGLCELCFWLSFL